MMFDDAFWSPVVVSIRINAVASVVVFLCAVAAGWWMARHSFPGKSIAETVLMLPLVLPPTVVGFGLLLLFGRHSWVGRGFEWLFDQPIIFTWFAAVIAAVVVAFPLVYQTVRAGFESVEKELEDVARTMGANEWQVFRHVTLPLSWRFLLSGYMFGFARGLGEFGATLMFAGNIPGETESIPTAIYIAVESGNTELAACWVISTILISFAMLFFINRLKRRGA
jgi:molybdate transport system permease protein